MHLLLLKPNATYTTRSDTKRYIGRHAINLRK